MPSSNLPTRRLILTGLGILAIVPGFAGFAAPAPAIHIVKVTGCACCTAWGGTLATAGYIVTVEDRDSDAVTAFRAENGIPEAVAGCHTARVGGYVIEGHVPAADIDRLLSERPEAVGLAVPGMPMGSPGMEFGGGREAFDVLLVRRDGTTTVFSSYAAS